MAGERELLSARLSSALIAEFIGTFALIFIGAGTGALGVGGLVGVAFAHGLVIVAFAYAYGHISGTHINPAVTIAAWVGGRIDATRAVSYIVVQILGGIVGALVLRVVLGGTETGLGTTTLAQAAQLGGSIITITPAAGLLIETILTFFLVNTIYNTAISGKAGDLAGLAIGMTLTLCILFGGPLTGASLNPARTIGPAVITGNYADLWVYIVGPIAGGVIATLLYRGTLAPERAGG
jgi:MIP family channel proteins